MAAAGLRVGPAARNVDKLAPLASETGADTFAVDASDPAAVARFREATVDRLMTVQAIVRNRRKIESAVKNARVVQAVAKEQGSFDRYVWSFVGGQPKRNAWKAMASIPAQTIESVALSKDLIAHGANFVGPTICYAFMQATGLVNDHVVSCFRYRQVSS